jgi:ParB-like chromosome segregation protein Spo0J
MLAGLVLAIAAVLLVLEPILRPGGVPAPVADEAEPEEDPREHRKELALAALKEIEFDRATGKLSDADYEKMLARYTKEAVEALREAEAVAAPAGGNGHGPAPVPAAVAAPAGAPADDAVERLIAEAREASRGRRFCTNCGAVLEGSGRFCVECGARV